MKGIISSEYGEILVDTDVIATYAGSVAVGCLYTSYIAATVGATGDGTSTEPVFPFTFILSGMYPKYTLPP